jgi:S-adenosylmethionine uptake transporter
MQSLWMVLGAFFFASMGVAVKFASASFNTFELVLYRGLISMVFLALLLRGRGIGLATRYPLMHAWRSVIGGISLTAWFYAIAHIPLATAMTLNYMSGIWVSAFIVGGALLYGRAQRHGPLVVTVLLGFAGVILTLRPTINHEELFAGLIGLMSGMCSSLAYLQVTALGRIGEPEGRTVFYFAVGTAVTGLAGIVWSGFTPMDQISWQAALWLVPIGVLASLGQWCMTRAYSRGHTLVVASLQYSGIVFASLYSVVVFGDDLPGSAWAGIALIIGSGVLATFLRERTLPDTPAEEH